MLDENPSLSGFSAAFNSPLTISGSALLYSAYTSQAVFNGLVFIKISTDGKFLVGGQLNFLDNNLSISGRLYADLSNVANGDVTILFLADIPDQIELLTVYGKIKMGFRNPSGEEVTFDVVTDPNAIPGGGTPTADIIAPVGDGQAVDTGVINDASNMFNGKYYVDVNYASSGGVSLDYDSILDELDEFTLSIAGSTPLDVSPIPIPVDTIINEFGIVETAELRVTGSGMDQKVVRVTKDASGIEVLTDILIPADLVDPPTEANALGKALLVAALRQTGVRRFRYVITQEGFTGFTKGDYTLEFTANQFKHANVTNEEGVTTPGLGNERFRQIFSVEGSIARLIDPANGANADINSLNGRNYIDVTFERPSESNLDLLYSSITDLGAEFQLSGAGIGSISLDSSQPALLVTDADVAETATFRYFLQGEFAESGDVALEFIEDSWSYTVEQTVSPVTIQSPAGANLEPGTHSTFLLEFSFPEPDGFTIDPGSVTDLNVEFIDADPSIDGIQLLTTQDGTILTIDENTDFIAVPETTDFRVNVVVQIALN